MSEVCVCACACACAGGGGGEGDEEEEEGRTDGVSGACASLSGHLVTMHSLQASCPLRQSLPKSFKAGGKAGVFVWLTL